MRSPVSASRVQPAPWKRGASRSWSASGIARTRRWPKRRLCLCCQKTVGDLPQGRGRTTRLEDRQTLMREFAQARAEGARLAPACALARIDTRTLQRWKAGDRLAQGDRRPANRDVPLHSLSEAERARIIEVANEPRFAAKPPARIVTALADEGISPASPASIACSVRMAR
jgi:putative transposase